MYSSILSLTLALDGGGWSTPCPGCFTPGKDPEPIVMKAGWVPGPVCMGAENLIPTKIRSSPQRVAIPTATLAHKQEDIQQGKTTNKKQKKKKKKAYIFAAT